jgi:hypothetical protein
MVTMVMMVVVMSDDIVDDDDDDVHEDDDDDGHDDDDDDGIKHDHYRGSSCRDLRKLATVMSSLNEPGVIVRRQAILLNFDPIRYGPNSGRDGGRSSDLVASMANHRGAACQPWIGWPIGQLWP